MKGASASGTVGRRTWFNFVALAVLMGVTVLLYLFTQPPPQPSEEPGRESSQTNQTSITPGSPAGRVSEPGVPLVEGTGGGTSLDLLVAELLDGSASLEKRERAAWELAKSRDRRALEALRAALEEGPRSLREVIAQALGMSPHPEARPLLYSLVQDADEQVARAALRGVARRGDLEAVDVLASVLHDESRSQGLRLEAAEALGSVSDPNALVHLMDVLSRTRDEDLASHTLEGLGQRPFAEVGEFFRQYLDTPGLSPEMRVAALEAVGGAEGDPSPLLLREAGHADPEVRAAAAWALSMTDPPGQAGPALLEWLQRESDPGVRTRLYQALAHQEGGRLSDALPLVQSESSLEAKLAALQWAAASLTSEPAPEVADYFNGAGVALLQQVALENESLHHRLTSVMALSRAQTPPAVEALREIVRVSADEQVVKAARVGLR